MFISLFTIRTLSMACAFAMAIAMVWLQFVVENHLAAIVHAFAMAAWIAGAFAAQNQMDREDAAAREAALCHQIAQMRERR